MSYHSGNPDPGGPVGAAPPQIPQEVQRILNAATASVQLLDDRTRDLIEIVNKLIHHLHELNHNGKYSSPIPPSTRRQSSIMLLTVEERGIAQSVQDIENAIAGLEPRIQNLADALVHGDVIDRVLTEHNWSDAYSRPQPYGLSWDIQTDEITTALMVQPALRPTLSLLGIQPPRVRYRLWSLEGCVGVLGARVLFLSKWVPLRRGFDMTGLDWVAVHYPKRAIKQLQSQKKPEDPTAVAHDTDYDADNSDSASGIVTPTTSKEASPERSTIDGILSHLLEEMSIRVARQNLTPPLPPRPNTFELEGDTQFQPSETSPRVPSPLSSQESFEHEGDTQFQPSPESSRVPSPPSPGQVPFKNEGDNNLQPPGTSPQVPSLPSPRSGYFELEGDTHFPPPGTSPQVSSPAHRTSDASELKAPSATPQNLKPFKPEASPPREYSPAAHPSLHTLPQVFRSGFPEPWNPSFEYNKHDRPSPWDPRMSIASLLNPVPDTTPDPVNANVGLGLLQRRNVTRSPGQMNRERQDGLTVGNTSRRTPSTASLPAMARVPSVTAQLGDGEEPVRGRTRERQARGTI